jgi:hypothetical protein
MGGDACTGTIKSLAVQVHCAPNGSAPNTSRTGWYYGEGQTNNAVPLASGMVPAEHEQDVIRYLVDDIANTSNGHLTTGFVGNKYVLPALTKFGEQTLALDMAVDVESPSWGYLVRAPATRHSRHPTLTTVLLTLTTVSLTRLRMVRRQYGKTGQGCKMNHTLAHLATTTT